MVNATAIRSSLSHFLEMNQRKRSGTRTRMLHKLTRESGLTCTEPCGSTPSRTRFDPPEPLPCSDGNTTGDTAHADGIWMANQVQWSGGGGVAPCHPTTQ